MIIGVPKEIKPNENRIALRPAGAEALIADGDYCEATNVMWRVAGGLAYLAVKGTAAAGGSKTERLVRSGICSARSIPCRPGSPNSRRSVRRGRSENTWHSFQERPIDGVRRSLMVNYVKDEWRSTHELSFPEQPIQ